VSWFASSQVTSLGRWKNPRPQTNNLLHETEREKRKRVKEITNLPTTWTGMKVTVEMEMK